MKKTIVNDHIVLFEYKQYNHKHIYSDDKYKYCVATYKRIPKNIKFQSEMVNDDNQDLCGGWGLLKEHRTDNEIILDRVLHGLKPFGSIFTKTPEDAENIINIVDKNKFFAEYIKRFNRNWYDYEINIAVKGKLEELFDLNTLYNDYINALTKPYNVAIEEEYNDYYVEEHTKEIILSSLNKLKQLQICNFFFNWDIEQIPAYITGLILGFPIENTISLYLENRIKWDF